MSRNKIQSDSWKIPSEDKTAPKAVLGKRQTFVLALAIG